MTDPTDPADPYHVPPQFQMRDGFTDPLLSGFADWVLAGGSSNQTDAERIAEFALNQNMSFDEAKTKIAELTEKLAELEKKVTELKPLSAPKPAPERKDAPVSGGFSLADYLQGLTDPIRVSQDLGKIAASGMFSTAMRDHTAGYLKHLMHDLNGFRQHQELNRIFKQIAATSGMPSWRTMRAPPSTKPPLDPPGTGAGQ